MRTGFQQLSGTALAALAAMAACLAAGVASAQPIADEIIVTTGFRPESIDRHVGSIAIIGADMIAARGAEHLESVLGAAANVTLTSGASRARFVQIRGIGDLEQFVDPKHYPSVGIRVDGIDLGSIASAAMLFDIEQIEVLRGPQGTEFGATALAGLIDVRSRAPAATPAGYVDVGLADYGTTALGVAAGGALADRLAGRIAVQQHRGDGYIDNLHLGRDDTNGYEETTLRTRLRWTPGKSTFDVTALRFEGDNGYDAYAFDNSRATLADQPGRDDLTLTALGLGNSWALDSGDRLEASVSWLDSEAGYGFDEDWAYVGFCATTSCPFGEFSNTDAYRRDREDIAVDLRWLGERQQPSGRELGFVLGVYAQDRSETLLRDYYGPFTSDYGSARSAVYGQLSLPLAARLTLTAGYRFERFDDEYRDSNAFASSGKDDFHAGEISISFAATPGSTLYAVAARGYKPGGVNTEASSVYGLLEPRFQGFVDSRLAFASEQLTSLELGLRSRLGDGRLALRAALFSMSREQAQLESWFVQYSPFLWVGLLDASDGDNTGFEVDLDFDVTAGWRLRASLGWLDTQVDSLTVFDQTLDDFVVRNGIEQAQAPAWQAYVGSEWQLSANWRLALDIEARDSHHYGYYHDGLIERATRVNASLMRQLGSIELTLWGRNLTDETYAVHGLYFGNDPRTGYLPERYLQLGEPRLIGLSLRHAF